MQIFALVLMLIRGDLSTKVLVDFADRFPVPVAGTALGIFVFRCVDDALFPGELSSASCWFRDCCWYCSYAGRASSYNGSHSSTARSSAVAVIP